MSKVKQCAMCHDSGFPVYNCIIIMPDYIHANSAATGTINLCSDCQQDVFLDNAMESDDED